MIQGVRRLLMMLVMGVALGCAAPALAQSPEAERLGVKIAHEVMSAIDFRSLVMKGAEGQAKALAGMDEYRSNWSKLAMEALEEEVAAASPAMERIIGRRLAAHFTLEELNAGDVIMSDPAIKAMVGAAAQGEDTPDFDCGRDCERQITSRAGRSFLRKFQQTDDFLDKSAQGDLIAAFIPGYLRRLADKIDASEKARTP